MPLLKAIGPSVAIIRFDPTKTRALRQNEMEHLVYHVTRLLAGEGTACAEWRHLGLSLEVEADIDDGCEG